MRADEHLREPRPPFSVWLREWSRTRDGTRLVAAVPALLALGAGVAFAVFLHGWQPARAEARCREVAERAFRTQDWETARIGYMSLLQLSAKQRDETAFRLSLCLLGLGRQREAAVLTMLLAPPQRLGYPPAHLFLAKSLLASTNLTESAVATAISRLERVAQGDRANAEAADLLSQLYMNTGRREQARRFLREIASDDAHPTRAEAMLRLSVLLSSEGDAAGAREWAGRAGELYRARVQATKADDPAARVGWVNALLLQRDFEAAARVLESGWQDFQTPAYKPLLVRVYADWVRALGTAGGTNLATRFRVLQRGLELDPANDVLVQELASFTALKGPEAEAARELVRQMLMEGRNAGLVHFSLGAQAWQAGERQKAFEQFRLAYEIAPDAPAIANNMAMTLTVQEPPDLERALAIIQSVVEKYPKRAEFRESRGQILLRLGRHREALEDLVFALPLLPEKSATHAALADAYRRLGMPDLAEEHDKAAKATAKKPPAGASAR